MTCNSAIYTENTTEQALLPNAQIPFGSIIRRFGRYCDVNGSDIVIGDCCSKNGNGYYMVDCSVTLEPTAIGNVSAQLYMNGHPYTAPVSGYSTTAGNPVNLKLCPVVRLFGECNLATRLFGECNLATLQVRLGDEAATVTDMQFRVVKL